MSNFAERLAARNAGAPLPPGLSMLAPRPVSRFEAFASLEADTAVNAEPAATTPAAGRVRAKAAPAVAHSPIENRQPRPARREAPETIAGQREGDTPATPHQAGEAISTTPRVATQPPRAAVSEPWHAPQDSDPLAREAVEIPARTPEVRAVTGVQPSAAPKDPAEAADTHAAAWPPALESASPAAVPDRLREIRTVRTERLAAAAPRQRMSALRENQATPAPTISIGKIEVQFLPREPAVSVAPPQPERTRGFATYARARRGEPR